MIGSQLGRTILAGSSGSADQQEASPDPAGSYGELMDAIDRILRAWAEQDGTGENPAG